MHGEVTYSISCLADFLESRRCVAMCVDHIGSINSGTFMNVGMPVATPAEGLQLHVALRRKEFLGYFGSFAAY